MDCHTVQGGVDVGRFVQSELNVLNTDVDHHMTGDIAARNMKFVSRILYRERPRGTLKKLEATCTGKLASR